MKKKCAHETVSVHRKRTYIYEGYRDGKKIVALMYEGYESSDIWAKVVCIKCKKKLDISKFKIDWS